jgi:predicted nucleic acid-binding protein
MMIKFLACAAAGGANYLVTYDPHFDVLEEMYRGIEITKALPFPWKVRGDQPPGF